jgi:ParB-like chromosome segregation protein Spo0J
VDELQHLNHNPVANVIWVPIDSIVANDYNPNQISQVELGLLEISILADGYTQPIVTVFDETEQNYIIVDGFHRFHCMRINEEIYQRNNGMLPIVVIDRDVNNRMASTIRHNRARGRHVIPGMSKLVIDLSRRGWSDSRICNELGMSPDELIRLKHVTGFASLFDDSEYSRSWVTKDQIKIKRNYSDDSE